MNRKGVLLRVLVGDRTSHLSSCCMCVFACTRVCPCVDVCEGAFPEETRRRGKQLKSAGGASPGTKVGAGS